jgi:predicted histone-like DNA-binding protein
MAVKYRAIPRRNPRDPDAPQKYYPSVSSTERVDLPDISAQISEISTVSRIDTLAVLEGFLTVLPRTIAAGKIVQLGNFGSFWLRVKSEGSDTPEQVSRQNIVNVLPLFTPGKEFKKILKNAEFVKQSE